MKLSDRLEAIVEMAPHAARAVDVGCDHGYTSIELVRRGKARTCIASDVRPGPLSSARENIAQNGLVDRISTTLADGLPGEMKTWPLGGDGLAVITGMGGLLIERILREGRELLSEVRFLLLSPQSDLAAVRRLLPDLGFALIAEQMLTEDGKYYTIMLAERSDAARLQGQACQDFGSREVREKVSDGKLQEDCPGLHRQREAEEEYGPLLLAKRDRVLHAYLLKQKQIRQDIKTKLLKTETAAGSVRLGEIQKELEIIDEALGYYTDTQ